MQMVRIEASRVAELSPIGQWDQLAVPSEQSVHSHLLSVRFT
jgi:hypothetical protein